MGLSSSCPGNLKDMSWLLLKLLKLSVVNVQVIAISTLAKHADCLYVFMKPGTDISEGKISCFFRGIIKTALSLLYNASLVAVIHTIVI